MRRRVVATLLVFAAGSIVAGCSGVDPDVLGDAVDVADPALPTRPAEPTLPPQLTPPAVASAGTGVFPGDSGAVPIVHQVDLAAGDALRVWATSTDPATEDPLDRGISIGVAVPVPVWDDLVAGDVIGNPDYRANFFSDYGFDDDDPSTYTFDPDVFGALVHWTSGGGSAQYEASANPPLYTCAARGREPDPVQGSWLVFVAPADATYSIWMLWPGPYELHVDTSPAPKTVPAGTGEYPFVDQAWVDVVTAHYAFLFDASAYPPDQFIAEDDGELVPFGPDVSAEDCSAPAP